MINAIYSIGTIFCEEKHMQLSYQGGSDTENGHAREGSNHTLTALQPLQRLNSIVTQENKTIIVLF